jgi:D-alanyl-D-alanine carboxypeptidase
VFTATAIMQLQERGKLSIDDSICKYLEPCPRNWRPVTIRHLLSHTSGLPGLGKYLAPGKVHSNLQRTKVSAVEILEQQRGKPLDFAAGTHYSYSNFGFFVAGLIIEKVTGKSYEGALREQIFRPLGMNDTGLDHPEIILPKRAYYYEDAHTEEWYTNPPPPDVRESLVNAEFYDMPSWMFSAGALYSTVGDMQKFGAALEANRLLQRPTLETMWTQISPVPYHVPGGFKDDGSFSTTPLEYALGWETHTVAGRRCFSHVGAGISAGTNFMYFPDERVIIVILANTPPLASVVLGLPSVIFGDR